MFENQVGNRLENNAQSASRTNASLFSDSYDFQPAATRSQPAQTESDTDRAETIDSIVRTNGESSIDSTAQGLGETTIPEGNPSATDDWMTELGFPSLTLAFDNDTQTAISANTDGDSADDSYELVSFTEPPTEPFNERELANFYRGLPARFGSNGSLSRTQLNNALLDPNLSIQEIGALTALRRYARQQPGQNISAARMTEITGALEGRTDGRTMPERQRIMAIELQNETRNWTDRAERLNMNLFANQTNPRASIVPEAVVQPRNVPNCHFISAISSMASVNPEQLQNMIQDNRNGTYTVTFPDMDPITVNAPTRGELLMYYENTDNGTWPAVLTAAYGRYWTPRGTLNIEGSNGSIRNDGLRTITGGGIDTDENRLTRYSIVNSSLAEAFRERRPVTAHMANEVGSSFGLTDNREDRTGLTTGHEYSVIGFTPNDANPSQAQITLRDPHGRVRWFNGRPPEGITDLGNGSFRMSLYEFNRTFSSLSYSTAAPRDRQ